MSDSSSNGSPVREGTGVPGRSSRPDIIALTGGKGGVGKTSVAVNLALTMARGGRRVLLLDADTDLANVSILLGLYPTRTLEHAMAGECRLADVIQEGPHGLHIIAGASGVQRCMDMDLGDAGSVLRDLAGMEQAYDTILIDTASGLRPAALHMIAAAALACVVITPDPASLTDAFSLLRVLQRRGYRRTPGVVVNMAAGASQAREVFRRFSGATHRHLGMDTEYIGAIWRDESIQQSVELQRPVALLSESDPSSRQFISLADQLIRHLSQLPARKSGLAAYWYHRSHRQQEVSAPETASPSPATADTEQQGNAPTGMHHQSTPPDSPREQCRALFADLQRLLAERPQDALLRQEALRGASALLSGMASEPETSLLPRSIGYSSTDFGSQDALLATLKSQPDSVRVEGFLAALSDNYDQ
ncbi:MinD/ParA family ATP-binding protein [Marinobacter zhanjiangensis]|uniref:MinD/ParA family ATP-binding protein n=1 Tax=Marinobacter zhanjiangensis TaxID=578215 RepID=UPI001D0F6867|nr:AAA family ATPase [Marinobacter zhanjiangensis]